MVIEEMMAFEEQILWEGGKSEDSTFWEAIFNPLLPFAAIWCVVDFSIIGTAGLANMIFSGMALFFLIHLMPVWLYLGGIIFARKKARNTRYVVTTRGIYIQTGSSGREQVKFYGYDEIKYAQTKQGMFDRQYNVGDVSCEFVTPIVKYSGRNRQVIHNFTLDNVADFQTVSQIINEQKRMQQPIGPQIPTLSQSSPLTARAIPPALQMPQPAPAVPQSLPAQQIPQQPEVADPQQAFFGQPENQMFTTEQRGDFLDQAAAADDAFFRNTPDESFSELQQELFGSEEVRTQAFPDPSVNPLPVLPGSAPQVTAQQGYQNAYRTDPYARPQTAPPYAAPQPSAIPYGVPNPYAAQPQTANPYAAAPEPGNVWGIQQEPEMESLITEPRFEDPTLRALEELKPLEQQDDNLQQSGM